MSLGIALQVVLAGLSSGAVYALIGIGFGLVYRMSGVLNFAQGDLSTLAIFVFLGILGGGTGVAATGVGPSLTLLALLASIVVVGAAGMVIQQFLVQPFLKRGSMVGWIAATAAVGLAIRSLVSLVFRSDSYSVPDILPLAQLPQAGIVRLPDSAILDLRALMVLVIALLIAVGFDLWLRRTISGQAMRAAAEAPVGARLVGIDPRRTQLMAWGIAGSLAAVAGLLIAPVRPVTISLGIVLGLKGMAAAVLGRLGSARGAILAGLALGVGESVLATLPLPGIGSLVQLHDLVPLVVLLIALAGLPALTGLGPRESG